MTGKAGGFLLLAFCVGLSYQICHNGICDTDRCSTNKDCPSCFACDTACGVCNTIPDCCMSHQSCPDWDGVCDLEVDPTTCNYCADTNLCTPGCHNDGNCEAGSTCQEHQCKPTTACSDDAFCNAGLSNICDIENFPYTTCFYCEAGDCLPGCVSSDNCPSGYTCDIDAHLCQAPAGKVLVESITVHTQTGCTAPCSNEGVTVTLLGKKDANFPEGLPCATNRLDHAATTDYDGSNGSKARFDGTLGGAEDENEKNMMGGCYSGPLNAELSGGTMVWQGEDGWAPSSVCVDWQSANYASECSASKTGPKTWTLVSCHDLTPATKCP